MWSSPPAQLPRKQGAIFGCCPRQPAVASHSPGSAPRVPCAWKADTPPGTCRDPSACTSLPICKVLCPPHSPSPLVRRTVVLRPAEGLAPTLGSGGPQQPLPLAVPQLRTVPAALGGVWSPRLLLPSHESWHPRTPLLTSAWVQPLCAQSLASLSQGSTFESGTSLSTKQKPSVPRTPGILQGGASVLLQLIPASWGDRASLSNASAPLLPPQTSLEPRSVPGPRPVGATASARRGQHPRQGPAGRAPWRRCGTSTFLMIFLP